MVCRMLGEVLGLAASVLAAHKGSIRVRVVLEFSW